MRTLSFRGCGLDQAGPIDLAGNVSLLNRFFDWCHWDFTFEGLSASEAALHQFPDRRREPGGFLSSLLRNTFSDTVSVTGVCRRAKARDSSNIINMLHNPYAGYQLYSVCVMVLVLAVVLFPILMAKLDGSITFLGHPIQAYARCHLVGLFVTYHSAFIVYRLCTRLACRLAFVPSDSVPCIRSQWSKRGLSFLPTNCNIDFFSVDWGRAVN